MALSSGDTDANVNDVCTEIYLQFPKLEKNRQGTCPTADAAESI
jgi:hypothetical protein